MPILNPLKKTLPALAAVLLALTACSPKEDNASGTSTDTESVSCAPGDLALKSEGTLTVGTDSPAYQPWFEDNDPSNGRGFESAVAYAVADKLGFAKDKVSWIKVPFNNVAAPGAKKFDFDINQVSISAARAKAVNFSDGYYSAAQAVIALKDSKASDATSLKDLADLKLGAQTGTTSLSAVRSGIKPTAAPLVFDDTNVAKQALLNKQVDAIVADLPTAFYITAAEIPQATIVAQFTDPKNTEKFGLVSEKGSSLTPCLNQALKTLHDDGTLARLEKQWLSEKADVPVFDFTVG